MASQCKKEVRRQVCMGWGINFAYSSDLSCPPD